MTRVWVLAILASMAVLLLPAAVPPSGSAAAERPARVASLNLCTDQLLVRLLDAERIASVSFLAADPTYSAVAEAAAALPLNHGRAEEILRQEPDLVLAAPYGARATVALLRRLGVSVLEVPLPASLDDARANIRTVAEALGEPERGEALVAELTSSVEENRDHAVDPRSRPSAIVYEANGITLGRGGLSDDVLNAAGLRNVAAEMGIFGPAPLSMERVMMARPDVLVLQDDGRGAPAQATAMLRHPAMAWLRENTESVIVPRALWSCGGPEVSTALDVLVEARRRAEAGEGGS